MASACIPLKVASCCPFMGHFVYLYRDQKGNPRYVGYGENSDRALSHMTQTHNVALEQLLQNSPFTLEIAGPFDSPETARSVETALISALEPSANSAQGQTQHRFRPIGVPLRFAAQFSLPPLSRDELMAPLQRLDSPCFFAVLIQQADFDEGKDGIRRGYDPANPSSDEEILARAERWWPLRRRLEKWKANASQSPAILLAVHGKPGAQFIIASVLLDRHNWDLAAPDPENPSRFQVPTLLTPQLNAENLRGRRIAPEVGLRFNLGGWLVFPS